MSAKKTIAREGLILIGVILLGCLISFIASIYPSYILDAKVNSKITYLDNGETRIAFEDGTIIKFDGKPSQQDILEAYSEAVKRKGKFDITTARPISEIEQAENKNFSPLTKEQFQKAKEAGLSFDQIVELEKSRKAEITPEQAHAELERRKLKRQEWVSMKRDEIRWKGLYILFIAYVLYLIPIKFITWAVRTLRTK